MSNDIVNVRRQVKMVNSFLRQGKPVPAAQAVAAVLRLMISTPLIKGEKDEFVGLVREGISYLNNDALIRKHYPLELIYTPGEERQLFESIQELLDVLKDAAVSEVEELAKAMTEKKQTAMDKGQEYLDSKDYNGARKIFKDISSEFPEDGRLRSDIGEKFLATEMYEDAVKYFTDSVAMEPNSLQGYNRLGIALRKIERFDVAEENFMKAMLIAPEDPNLLFNIGRLYVDLKKWDKALEYGEKAYALRPEFSEAQKLTDFARKRLG